MPLRIISADAAGRLDGTVKATILDRLASRPGTPDATIVAVSNFPDYRFNPELRSIRGPWVMVDFMEYGASVTEPDKPFGSSKFAEARKLPAVCSGASGEWLCLDYWAFANPPALYLKRELLTAAISPRVRPIDWPAMQPAPPVQTKAEFDARPLEVFSCWGYSNPLRTKLHADIFEAMGTRGVNVDDDMNGVDAFIAHSTSGRRWLSAYAPYWRRSPMAQVMAVQGLAKISVSLPGFGLKCFRHAEAPVGAVMAMTDDPLAWSFPWVHGVNCIRAGRDLFMSGLLSALRWHEWHREFTLYECYRQGQETIDRYRPDRYVDEYLLPAIAEALG